MEGYKAKRDKPSIALKIYAVQWHRENTIISIEFPWAGTILELLIHK